MDSPRVIRVAIGIVLAGDRVLIARRPDHVPLPGLWEFPGGKIEPGETPEAAVVRELSEELAVTVTPVRRLTRIEQDYPHGRVVLTPLLCRHVAGKPQAIGCSEWEWAFIAALSMYTFPEANQPLLEELKGLDLQVKAQDVNFRGP